MTSTENRAGRRHCLSASAIMSQYWEQAEWFCARERSEHWPQVCIAVIPLHVFLCVATYSPVTPMQAGCEGLKPGINLFDPSIFIGAKLGLCATTWITPKNLLCAWLHSHP